MDLINQKFNKWTVIGPRIYYNSKPYRMCQCDCGTIRKVPEFNLKNGHSKSCGCLRKAKASEVHSIDLTGQQFGQLTVLKRDYNKKSNSHRYIFWKCQCKCGNIVTVSSDNLKRQQSCGCLKSIGEQNIINILTENNVKYVKEYSVKELGLLRYDFYLPEYNRLIEFDGIQHYQIVDYFGGKQTFLTQQKNDEKKNNYAKQNNIDLVRIPYYLQDQLTLDDLLGNKYLI